LTCGTLDKGDLLESFSWNLIASVSEMAIFHQLMRTSVDQTSDLAKLSFALPIVGINNGLSRRRCMSRRFSKVGAILLLLLLLFGPVLQAVDCFNDAPNLDHDGVLHGVEALLCFAFTLLIFSSLLLANIGFPFWSVAR